MQDWDVIWPKIPKAKVEAKLLSLTGPRPYKDKSISHRELEKRKAMTQYIDYGCELCHHNVRLEKQEGDEKRCCVHCARTFGYLPEHRLNVKNLKVLMQYYDKKHGFWRPKVGCILPRKMRSVTCLCYGCYLQGPERRDLHKYLRGEDVPIQLSLPMKGLRAREPESPRDKICYGKNKNERLKMYWQTALS